MWSWEVLRESESVFQQAVPLLGDYKTSYLRTCEKKEYMLLQQELGEISGVGVNHLASWRVVLTWLSSSVSHSSNSGMALILLLQQKGCVDTKAAGYCTSLAARGNWMGNSCWGWRHWVVIGLGNTRCLTPSHTGNPGESLLSLPWAPWAMWYSFCGSWLYKRFLGMHLVRIRKLAAPMLAFGMCTIFRVLFPINIFNRIW